MSFQLRHSPVSVSCSSLLVVHVPPWPEILRAWRWALTAANQSGQMARSTCAAWVLSSETQLV
jgi:hypothetical protein